MKDDITHTFVGDDGDHERMTLSGQPDENTVTVFFDGDTEDTATMSLRVYDHLTNSGEWVLSNSGA